MEKSELNEGRRKFVKILLIGGASFMVGKILGPLYSKFSTGSSTKKDSTAFKISEDEKSLAIYDSSGAEVLYIDKEG